MQLNDWPSHSADNWLQQAVNSAHDSATSFSLSLSVSLTIAMIALQTRLYLLLADSESCLAQCGSIFPGKLQKFLSATQNYTCNMKAFAKIKQCRWIKGSCRRIIDKSLSIFFNLNCETKQGFQPCFVKGFSDNDKNTNYWNPGI